MPAFNLDAVKNANCENQRRVHVVIRTISRSFTVILLSCNCHINLTELLHNQHLTKQKGVLMIIDWVAAKVQYFLPGQNAGLDELSTFFDFALSPEMTDLLYAQNDGRMDAKGTRPWLEGIESKLDQRSMATQEAVAEEEQADQPANIPPFSLDEYEQALT